MLCKDNLRRYCSCLRCDFRVSRLGHRHRPLETSRGALLKRYRNVTFGLDVFGPATLTAPCFALLVAASSNLNRLFLSRARPTAPQPTSAGRVTRATGGRCLPNGRITAKDFLLQSILRS